MNETKKEGRENKLNDIKKLYEKLKGKDKLKRCRKMCIINFIFNDIYIYTYTVEHRLYVFQGTVFKKRITEKNVQPKICNNTLI